MTCFSSFNVKGGGGGGGGQGGVEQGGGQYGGIPPPHGLVTHFFDPVEVNTIIE